MAMDRVFPGLPDPSDLDPSVYADMKDPISKVMPQDVGMNDEGHPAHRGLAGEGNGPLSDEDYQSAIDGALSAAENYTDTYLSPDRELAASYYFGEPFGNEEDGKSDVVITEVRDSILATMPDLLRVFCGSTDPVEFTSMGGSDPDVARQQTNYINHIFMVDNPGFRVTLNVFKDALRGRIGVATWWHEEKEIVSQYPFSGITQDELMMLQNEAMNKSDDSESMQYHVQVTGKSDDTDATGAPITFFDGVTSRHFKQKRFKVRALPPEEFIFTPGTSDELEDFELVGTRSTSTFSKLIETGYDRAKIQLLMDDTGEGGAYSDLESNPERMRRDDAAMDRIFDSGFESVSPPSREVKVCTLYILVDRDGDGIAERRKVVTVGDQNTIILDEVYGTDKLLPFAIYCPDPEPHTPIGMSMADQTMDLQEIKSQLVRRTLDSLDQSINSRQVVIEGQTNLDDVLNPENGAVIRVKMPGAVQQLQTQFLGQQAMPMLSYFDEVRTRRTGQSTNPTGLEADTLQSTTKSAADAMVQGAAARSEMIARIFAETGHTRLFRGLLQLVTAHQDYKRVVKLQGSVVSVDPRSWDVDTALQVNVGVGRGQQAQRVASLSMILQQQQAIYEKLGPGNPVVGLDHISYTQASMIREMGFSDPSKFFNLIDKPTAAKISQTLANAPKTPTPEQLLLQAQREKLGTDAALKREQMQLEEAKAILDDDQKRDAAQLQFEVQAAEYAAEYGAQINQARLDAEMADHQMMDGAIKSQLAIQAGVSGQAAQTQMPAPAPNGGATGTGGSPTPGAPTPPNPSSPSAPTPPTPSAPAQPAPAAGAMQPQPPSGGQP